MEPVDRDTRPKSPHIEVGILNTTKIRLEVEGRFYASGQAGETDRPVEWNLENTPVKWNQENRPVEWNLKNSSVEVTLTGETFEVFRNGEVLGRFTSFRLDPVDFSSCRITIRDVVIGIGFHWEQKEDQVFRGSVSLMPLEGGIQAVNSIPLEEYLVSVISSEMRGDSASELLKAHTIISRSWLLAQIEKQDRLSGDSGSYHAVMEREGEYIRWYDREDHTHFHVCADDHCQRYQGITRASNPAVEKAVRETAGEVLIYGDSICDARFSKCCGGVVEQFEHVWEPVSHPYLRRVDDNPPLKPVNTADLKIEENAVRFIETEPAAFCNTRDARLLRQVLNDYDQSSPDFYRWTVEYTQEELSGLIREKSGLYFGRIRDLVPVERGESARLVKLKIVGTERTLVVGKELEIRRWLSPSHLYSSAFTVEKLDIRDGIPEKFLIRGAGWGHGVGLCQIGASVMADRGYSHREILMHYFIDSSIEKRYE